MNDIEKVVGKTISAIMISETMLVFQTDAGLVGFRVEGDCCSQSYFHDFYGVKNLLENGPVTAAEAVELAPGDIGYRAETWDTEAHPREWQDVVQVYGFRLTTEHPTFGPVSSVVSFRNDSNGYYGGWMDAVEVERIDPTWVTLWDDCAHVEAVTA